MKPRVRGFSLVEMLVSVLIGLLALIFVMRSSVDFEKNRRSGIGGSDSMQNGIVALFSMETDASQAGWGLNDPNILGCPGRFYDTQNFADANVTAGVPLVYAPIQVTFNGANPDVITFLSGSAESGTGSVGVGATPPVVAGSTVLPADAQLTFYNAGDVLLLAPLMPTAGVGAGVQNGPCVIAQVASIAGSNINIVNNGSQNTRFNRSGGILAAFPGSGMSKIYNLGPGAALSFHTWDVSNGVMRLRATDLAGASNAPVSAVGGIVTIKALYGFDTRPAPPGATIGCVPGGAVFQPDCGTRITRWSAGMVDANADGSTNSMDYQRLVAVRLAVVARSRLAERPTPGRADCTDTIPANAALPTVFGAQEPSGVTSVPIQVNVAVTGDTTDWTCYRYRTFETIVPLRNSGWKPA